MTTMRMCSVLHKLTTFDHDVGTNSDTGLNLFALHCRHFENLIGRVRLEDFEKVMRETSVFCLKYLATLDVCPLFQRQPDVLERS